MSSWSEKFIDAFNTHEVAPILELFAPRIMIAVSPILVANRLSLSPRTRHRHRRPLEVVPRDIRRHASAQRMQLQACATANLGHRIVDRHHGVRAFEPNATHRRYRHG